VFLEYVYRYYAGILQECRPQKERICARYCGFKTTEYELASLLSKLSVHTLHVSGYIISWIVFKGA